MFSWFARAAPIRTKFDVLTLLYGGLAAGGLATTIAAQGHLAPTAPVIAATGLLVLTLIVASVSRSLICNPYVTSVASMEKLAAGDLDNVVLLDDYSDCIGRMSKAVQVFRRNAADVRQASEAQQVVVTALGKALGELAQGNLSETIRTPFPADYEQLRADYNRAIQSLGAAMGKVVAATRGIHVGANDIHQASDDLSQRTEQQAASLEETAAAMDEITSTVRQATEGARRANDAVSEARREAEHSGTVVRRAVEAMAGIERGSSEISEIISVIDGIAFQTNLLALNAGVEAARAGDAGRGFAVVASEVRALAQRSADAAKDVKARILASSEQVEAGVGLVSETGLALERIIGRITEISGLVEHIATSADRQSIGLQEVNIAVSQMDGVTQQNAAMVEQATAAARALAIEADGLAQEIARFRIADADGPATGLPEPIVRAVAAPATAQPVHALQRRAAAAGHRIARAGRVALAVNEDEWTES
ncbi:methyl-accepting chemotaxis protein [Sphingomonadaceae bacterium jetA1]|uniref:methyl-accepting chemotaxis protein n=1 Tax=Facivitalis istanbulensis TaxID=3075838 RepID=UPI003472E92A